MSNFLKSLFFVLIIIIVYPFVSQSVPTLPKISLLPTVRVPLSGTGSMYPTVPKGTANTNEERANQTVTYMHMYRFTATPSALNKFIFISQISRGDIVSFQNATTNKIEMEKYGKTGGFVKRVIGLPGETIQLKDGVVYIDDIPQREPYTALPHSTFGGDFIQDCQKLKIPENKVFVMGDNRKESGDSRNELGFVDLKDINFILPWDKQTGNWDKNYRPTTMDLDPSTKIQTDKQSYLNLLNQKRAAKKLPLLKYNNLLEKSAVLRAQSMLKTNDFSFEATRSGLTEKQAMSKAGYWNSYYGETWRQGYYTALELIDNQFAFQTSKDFVLDPKFDDIGIGILEGEINNCPTQLIVTHYAGYIPPNYSQSLIKSWVDTLQNLKEASPGWQQLKKIPQFYSANKSEIDEINRIIDLRLNRLPPLVEKLKNQQWLTEAEEKLLDEDINLNKQQNSLADRLNSH